MFGEITVDLCNRFRDYLLHARQLKHTDKMVSRNSAASYFSLFRGVLKLAYRDKYLRENPNDFLEKIESRDIHKEFLTQDELKDSGFNSMRYTCIKKCIPFLMSYRITHQ